MAIHAAKAPTIVPQMMNIQKPHWYPSSLTASPPPLIKFKDEMANAQVTIDRATSSMNSTLLMHVKLLPLKEVDMVGIDMNKLVVG